LTDLQPTQGMFTIFVQFLWFAVIFNMCIVQPMSEITICR